MTDPVVNGLALTRSRSSGPRRRRSAPRPCRVVLASSTVLPRRGKVGDVGTDVDGLGVVDGGQFDRVLSGGAGFHDYSDVGEIDKDTVRARLRGAAAAQLVRFQPLAVHQQRPRHARHLLPALRHAVQLRHRHDGLAVAEQRTERVLHARPVATHEQQVLSRHRLPRPQLLHVHRRLLRLLLLLGDALAELHRGGRGVVGFSRFV